MKKKVCFITCLFLCIFTLAIASSAAEPSFGELASEISGIPEAHLFGDSNTASVHHDGYYNAECARVLLTYEKDGTAYTVTYPSYYVLKNDSTLTWNFAPVSTHLGVTLTVENVTQIEIPYGITDIPVRAFVDSSRWDPTVSEEHPYGHATESSALTYVSLPDTLLKIEDFAFAHCTALDRIDAHVSENGVTGLHDHIRVNYIGYRAFHHCPITSFPFNAHLTHLGEGAFQGCCLETIDLSKCIELDVIPAYCFHESNASNIDSIILGPNVKKIGDYAFTDISASTVFLGTSLEEVGHGALTLGDIDTIFWPVTLKTIYSDSITFSNKGYKTMVVGSRDEAKIEELVVLLKEINQDYKNVSASNVLKATNAYFKGNNEFCETYCGGHLVGEGSEITGVSFPNGIQYAGSATGPCDVCQNEIETISLPPILVSKGYSICTYNGKNAFTNGFEVYHDSLNAYESVYGSLELGIVFVLNRRYQSVDLYSNISSMGAALSVKEGGESFPYESFNFIFYYSKGIEETSADGVKRGDEEVIIAAYAKETNSNTIHYVQDDDLVCSKGETSDEKYITVSYNSIFGYIEEQGLS